MYKEGQKYFTVGLVDVDQYLYKTTDKTKALQTGKKLKDVLDVPFNHVVIQTIVGIDEERAEIVESDRLDHWTMPEMWS